MAKILFIDDIPGIIESYRYDIEKEGHDFVSALSVAGARKRLEENPDVDVIILDMKIPEEDEGVEKSEIGIDFLRELSETSDKPVIMLTAMGGDAYRKEALDIGAYDYVGKEEDRSTLLARMRNAAAEGMESLENQCLRIGMFPGQSEVFQTYLKKLKSISQWDWNILIYGETGSGKDLAAQASHMFSKRRNGPFIADNCSGIKPELFESTVFGNEKGAFTGAFQQHKGLFEQADKGTLFLDEIGDLPLDMQPKLLRVIREGRFKRVGGEEDINVDVRVIAASNKDLGRMVQESIFREDLFSRLNRGRIDVPSLHERCEDIFSLAKHLMERINWTLEFNNRKRFLDECRKPLEKYEWRCNVADLETIVERLFVYTEARDITQNIIEKELSTFENERMGHREVRGRRISKFTPFHPNGMIKTFDEVKEELLICESLKKYLIEAYRTAERNWGKTAVLIGVTDDTLRKYRKMLNNEGLAV